MRISKDIEERKNEILDTAEILFATKGYSKTTINDIIQTIEIAKGTFYYYYKSKEEVMNEIVMRFINRNLEIVNAIAQDSKLSAIEKLSHIIQAQTLKSNMKKQMIKHLYQVKNEEMRQNLLVQTILKLTPVLTIVVEQGIKEGKFNTPYPKQVVEFFLTSTQVLFDNGILQWETQEIIQRAKAFCHIAEVLLDVDKESFRDISAMFEQILINQM